MSRMLRLSLVLILISGCTATGTAEPSAAFPSPTVPITMAPTVAPTATFAPSAVATPTPALSAAPSLAAGCPTSPMRVDALLADGETCYGAQAVTVIGWLAPAWGIGGVDSGIEPAWLGELPPDPVLWHQPRNPTGCFADDDCLFTFLHRAPATLDLSGPERWVAVTGHFHDPAAETCIWGGSIGQPISTEDAVARCRLAFVATAVEDAVEP